MESAFKKVAQEMKKLVDDLEGNVNSAAKSPKRGSASIPNTPTNKTRPPTSNKTTKGSISSSNSTQSRNRVTNRNKKSSLTTNRLLSNSNCDRRQMRKSQSYPNKHSTFHNHPKSPNGRNEKLIKISKSYQLPSMVTRSQVNNKNSNNSRPLSPTNPTKKVQPTSPIKKIQPTTPTSLMRKVQPTASPTVNVPPTWKTTESRIIPNNPNIALPYRCYSSNEIMKCLRGFVEKAIRQNKTFTVIGNWHVIREALKKRGWIEKISLPLKWNKDSTFRFLQTKSIDELLNMLKKGAFVHAGQLMIMSKLLALHQVDFYWNMAGMAYSYYASTYSDEKKMTLLNHIRRKFSSYSSKNGLAEAIKYSHWFLKAGVYKLDHPRSYYLVTDDNTEEFINDFKFTAARSLLLWVVYNGSKQRSISIVSRSGSISLTIFEFALKECLKQIKKFKHIDIDQPILEDSAKKWNIFLENYYKIVHQGCHFAINKVESQKSMVKKAKTVLKQLKMFVPYVDADGVNNVWILKPCFGSQGHGIHMCRTLQYILKVISQHQKTNYVIQKYIERPLLIYNTKFDIRQWFLISSTVPLTIWMYKLCYLRFSSQTYNLRKLHESIHLTNNSVQTRYKNGNRDPNLPQHNMWDSTEFQKYLENAGYPNVYKNIIYPGMRQCFVAAVLLNQEYICARRNSFELYGADFMITEDFKPWLIEINSRPALYPSTPVTGKLCPMVLEDVIKVVIDHARDPNSKTGHFELIYKQTVPPLPECDVNELKLVGTPLPLDYFSKGNTTKTIDSKTKSSSTIIDINDTTNYMKFVKSEMRKTLEKLLTIIRTERARRKKLKNVEKRNKDEEISKSNKNIEKGVEYVLEIKEIFKNSDKTVSTENNMKSTGSQVALIDLIKIGGDTKQEVDNIKETLLKITENSESSSTTIFNDVLRLLNSLSKD